MDMELLFASTTNQGQAHARALYFTQCIRDLLDTNTWKTALRFDLLWEHRAFSKLPAHVRALDVGGFRPGGNLATLGDVAEFFLLTEYVGRATICSGHGEAARHGNSWRLRFGSGKRSPRLT